MLAQGTGGGYRQGGGPEYIEGLHDSMPLPVDVVLQEPSRRYRSDRQADRTGRGQAQPWLRLALQPHPQARP